MICRQNIEEKNAHDASQQLWGRYVQQEQLVGVSLELNNIFSVQEDFVLISTVSSVSIDACWELHNTSFVQTESVSICTA